MYNPGERRLLAKTESPKLLKNKKRERERKKKMNVLNQIKILNIYKANDTINKKGQSPGKNRMQMTENIKYSKSSYKFIKKDNTTEKKLAKDIIRQFT